MVHQLDFPLGRRTGWSAAASRRGRGCGEASSAPSPAPAIPAPDPNRAIKAHTAETGAPAVAESGVTLPLSGFRPPIADPSTRPTFKALLAAAYPQLRMPGARRFDPTQGDRCICAVPLLWTDEDGWVHLADGRPCPLPRTRR
jgi:hypothetical protein